MKMLGGDRHRGAEEKNEERDLRESRGKLYASCSRTITLSLSGRRATGGFKVGKCPEHGVPQGIMGKNLWAAEDLQNPSKSGRSKGPAREKILKGDGDTCRTGMQERSGGGHPTLNHRGRR